LIELYFLEGINQAQIEPILETLWNDLCRSLSKPICTFFGHCFADLRGELVWLWCSYAKTEKRNLAYFSNKGLKQGVILIK